MSVSSMTSNEFEAAAHLLHTIPPCAHGPLDETACGHCSLTALAALGWGPKPTVKLKRIQEYGRFDQLITDYLESCGIEVTP